MSSCRSMATATESSEFFMAGGNQLIEQRGPTIEVAVRDPVWLASIKRAYSLWRPTSVSKPRLLMFESWRDLLAQKDRFLPRLLVMEVDRESLPQVAELLSLMNHRTRQRVIGILGRGEPGGFERPTDRAAAAAVLNEAGARLTIASPRHIERVFTLAERFFSAIDTPILDPLDQLPLACWGPGWQRGVSGDRL